MPIEKPLLKMAKQEIEKAVAASLKLLEQNAGTSIELPNSVSIEGVTIEEVKKVRSELLNSGLPLLTASQ